MARPLDHLRMCLPLLLFIPFYYLFSEFFKMEFIQNIHPVMIIVVLVFFEFIIFSTIMVGLHRVFLMDDESIAKTKAFRLGVREWNFAAWIIKIGLFMIALVVAVNYVFEPLLDKYEYIEYILIAPAAYIFARLSILLPATAVENRNVSLQEAWKLSKNNGLQLFVLVSVLPYLTDLIMGLISGYQSIAYQIVIFIIWGVVLILEVGFLSMCYAWLKGYVDTDSTVD